MYPAYFVLSLANGADRCLLKSKGRLVKSLVHNSGFWRLYKEENPLSYLVGRQYWHQDKLRRLVTHNEDYEPFIRGLLLSTTNCPYDGLAGPNEYIAEFDPLEYWARAVEIELAFAKAVRSTGRHYWALSMSTHNLPPPWVVARLRGHVDGILVHLYSCDEPWPHSVEIPRYQDFIKTCGLPIIFGEWGRDCLAQRGWQAQNVSSKDYALEFDWACVNMPAYGATVFCLAGGNEEWRRKGFDVIGCEEILYLIRFWDYTDWQPPIIEDGNMSYEILFGFAEVAEALGAEVIGEPLENQWHHVVGNRRIVTQRTTKGYFQTEEYPYGSEKWRPSAFYSATLPKALAPAS